MTARRTLRVRTSFLDVFQEGENEQRIELLNLDAGRGGPQSGSREAEQQLKAVGVGRAGVRARSPLVRQMLANGGEMQS